MNITEQIDREISQALCDDEFYKDLTKEEKELVLGRLNGMLHHTLYDEENDK